MSFPCSSMRSRDRLPWSKRDRVGP
jgi:hypothetical protein